MNGANNKVCMRCSGPTSSSTLGVLDAFQKWGICKEFGNQIAVRRNFLWCRSNSSSKVTQLTVLSRLAGPIERWRETLLPQACFPWVRKGTNSLSSSRWTVQKEIQTLTGERFADLQDFCPSLFSPLIPCVFVYSYGICHFTFRLTWWYDALSRWNGMLPNCQMSALARLQHECWTPGDSDGESARETLNVYIWNWSRISWRVFRIITSAGSRKEGFQNTCLYDFDLNQIWFVVIICL
jgi:hypothetical protein